MEVIKRRVFGNIRWGLTFGKGCASMEAYSIGGVFDGYRITE